MRVYSRMLTGMNFCVLEFEENERSHFENSKRIKSFILYLYYVVRTYPYVLRTYV